MAGLTTEDLLSILFAEFEQEGCWPLYRHLELRMYRDHGQNLRDVLTEIDDGLLVLELPIGDESRVGLTLDGMARVPAAVGFIDLVVAAVGLMGRRYLASDGTSEVTITTEEIGRELGVGQAESLRLCAFLWSSGWPYASGKTKRNDGTDYSFRLSNCAMHFAEVSSLEDLRLATEEVRRVEGMDPYLVKRGVRMPEEASTDLNPWPVIAVALFELESDDVVDVCSIVGLSVDWEVNKEEGYSNKSRKRAYRPRVDSAMLDLTDDARLRVCLVVTREIVQRNPEVAELLGERLRHLGWDLVEGELVPGGKTLSELFIGKGQEHDAYVEIRHIVHTAKDSILVVDPYIDGSVLSLIGSAPRRPLTVKILTTKVPPDFTTETARFARQHTDISLEVRKTKDFHDRFIVIDGKSCFHIGASLKDAGGKAFMISRIEDQANTASLIAQQDKSWSNASQL